MEDVIRGKPLKRSGTNDSPVPPQKLFDILPDANSDFGRDSPAYRKCVEKIRSRYMFDGNGTVF